MLNGRYEVIAEGSKWRVRNMVTGALSPTARAHGTMDAACKWAEYMALTDPDNTPEGADKRARLLQERAPVGRPFWFPSPDDPEVRVCPAQCGTRIRAWDSHDPRFDAHWTTHLERA